MLFRFLRDENRKPFGVMVAVQNDDGALDYGVSLCNSNDQWNRDRGREIALGRAYCGRMLPELPRKKESTVLHQLNRFMAVAPKHFRGVTRRCSVTSG